MGWWKGSSPLAMMAGEESELVWGDGPGDILDEAVDKIVEEFNDHLERNPTKDEIRAGLEFCLGGYPTDEVMNPEELEIYERNHPDAPLA